jgi:hypothetical protein
VPVADQGDRRDHDVPVALLAVTGRLHGPSMAGSAGTARSHPDRGLPGGWLRDAAR